MAAHQLGAIASQAWTYPRRHCELPAVPGRKGCQAGAEAKGGAVSSRGADRPGEQACQRATAQRDCTDRTWNSERSRTSPPTAEPGQSDPSSGASGGSGTGKGEPKTTAPSVTPDESVNASPAGGTPTAPKSRLGPLFYGGLAVGGALIVGGVITGIVGLSSANTLQSTPYAGPADASSVSALQSRVRGLGYATDILIPVGVATIAVTTIVSLVRKPAVENRPPPGAAMNSRPSAASTGSAVAKVETPSATPVVIPVAPLTPTPPVAATTPVVVPTAPSPAAPSPAETPSAAVIPNPTP